MPHSSPAAPRPITSFPPPSCTCLPPSSKPSSPSPGTIPSSVRSHARPTPRHHQTPRLRSAPGPRRHPRRKRPHLESVRIQIQGNQTLSLRVPLRPLRLCGSPSSSSPLTSHFSLLTAHPALSPRTAATPSSASKPSSDPSSPSPESPSKSPPVPSSRSSKSASTRSCSAVPKASPPEAPAFADTGFRFGAQ